MILPIELSIHIFGHLSFPDILNFAATCRRHRQIWQEHTNIIYNLVRLDVRQQRLYSYTMKDLLTIEDMGLGYLT